MKTIVLSLGIALVALMANAEAQVSLRKSTRARAGQGVQRADYNHYESSRTRIAKVQYVDDCGDGCAGGGCGGGGGCGVGCGGGGCGGIGGIGCNHFGSKCGCAPGPTTSLPYPRCFSFQSPCVARGTCGDPCCGTIFAEMWCDVQNWFGALSAMPSAACIGSCAPRPVGFRSSCGGGCCGGGTISGCGLALPKISFPCFQDLLAPRCVGGCGTYTSCSKPSLLSGFGGMLLSSCGLGCTTSYGGCGGCGGCGDFANGYYGGEGSYYTGNAPSTSHRYYATTRPNTNRAEYVTASEYSRIEAQRAEEAEMIARRNASETQRRAATPRRTEQPRTARRPTKPQARNDASRRTTRRRVKRVSYDQPEPAIKLLGPKLNEPGAEVTPYVEFLDKKYRD